MLFHLSGVEILEIADGGGTLVSAWAFIVICPIAAEMFRSGTKKLANGRTVTPPSIKAGAGLKHQSRRGSGAGGDGGE